ncbi:hypothetical protein, partial [Actinoallomurus acaciae]
KMAKFAILAAVLGAVVIAQAFPASDSDIFAAASKGNWDEVHKLIKDQFNDKSIWEPNFGSGSVRSLQSPPGGHVFGQSEYTFKTSSNVNGKTSENSGGHRVINNDGKVEEFDFQP